MPSAGRNIAAACLLTFASVASSQNTARVVSCRPGVWALTFDDGPSQHTPALLEHLEAADVKASFFVLGSQLEDAKNAEYLKQAFDAGHQIASHTYSHKSLSEMDSATMTKEMEDTAAKIEAAIGRRPNYMRPPFGECGDSCEETMGTLGYTIAIWNIDSQDWRYADKPAEQDQLVEDIKRYEDGKGAVAQPTDPEGVVSLQHDIQPFSVERTPQIIEYIKSQGYTFATVAECGQEGDRAGPYRGDAADTTSEPATTAQPTGVTNTTSTDPSTGVTNTTSPVEAQMAADQPVNATNVDGSYTASGGPANATTATGDSQMIDAARPMNATTNAGDPWASTASGKPVNATAAGDGSSKTSSTTSDKGSTNESANNRTANSSRSRRVNEINSLGSSASTVCPPGQFAAWTAAGLFGLTKLF